MAPKTGKRKTYKGRGLTERKKNKKPRNAYKAAYAKNTKSGLLVSVPSYGGLPPRFRTRLVYDDVIADKFQPGTTIWNAIFRLNSLYDFDYSNVLGNFQPGGRDRLAALYSLAIVRNVTLLFEVVHARDSTAPAGSGAAPSITVRWSQWAAEGTTTLPTAPTYPAMLAGSRCKMLAIDNKARLVQKINMAKLAGLDGSPFNSGLGFNTNNNPGKPCWGELIVSQDTYGANEFNMFSVHVRAIFDVEYAQPIKSELDTN